MKVLNVLIITCSIGSLLLFTGGNALQCYSSVGINDVSAGTKVTCPEGEVCYKYRLTSSIADGITKGCVSVSNKPMTCTMVGSREECFCNRELCNGGSSLKINFASVLSIVFVGVGLLWKMM